MPKRKPLLPDKLSGKPFPVDLTDPRPPWYRLEFFSGKPKRGRPQKDVISWAWDDGTNSILVRRGGVLGTMETLDVDSVKRAKARERARRRAKKR